MTPIPPVADVSIFLKELYTLTKAGPVKCNVTALAVKHNIMYKMLMSKVMQQAGIIEKRPKKQWVWTSTTEPNVHMAEALIKACNKKATTKKEHPFSSIAPVIHDNEYNHITGTIEVLKNRVTTKALLIMTRQNRPDDYVFNIKKDGEFILIW